jgi:hypothetical protein
MIGPMQDEMKAGIPVGNGHPCTVPGTVYENFHQDVLHITADKAHRYLDDWRQKIEAQGSWLAPLSLGASLLMTLLTADFKDRFNVPKEYWSALFFVCFLAAVIWLFYSIRRRLQNPPVSSNQIVERFKNGTS